MQFRAIATDLDGTLLRRDSTVSARTRDAVDAAEEAGLLFVIATGRPPRWIPPVIEQLGERGLVVCANGGERLRPGRATNWWSATTSTPMSCGPWSSDLLAAFPEAVLGVEQGFEFGGRHVHRAR